MGGETPKQLNAGFWSIQNAFKRITFFSKLFNPVYLIKKKKRCECLTWNSGSQVRQGWTAPKGTGSAVTQAGWDRHLTPCSNHHEGELQPITAVITDRRDGLLEEVEQEFTDFSLGTGNSSVTLVWMYNPSFGFRNAVCKENTGMQCVRLMLGFILPHSWEKRKMSNNDVDETLLSCAAPPSARQGQHWEVDFRTKTHFMVFFSN